MLEPKQHKQHSEEKDEERSLEKTLKTTSVVLFMLISLILVLHPHLRYQIRQTLQPDFRTVLASATGDLLGNGMPITVIKIKTRDHLLLEIYEPQAGLGTSDLIDKIVLADRRDGFFHFNGDATNLLLFDINDNKQLDIVTSSYDEDLIAHLSLFEFNKTTQKFEHLLE